MASELKSKLKGRELIELEKKLAEYKGRDEVISSKEYAEMLKNEPQANFSHSTGIALMDNILDKVESGELILITGPTGQGKTSLLMTLTRNMDMGDVKSVWFSFELTPHQFFKKFNYLPPLFYLPKENLDNTIFWIEERILEAIVKYDIKVVYIDDLHHIFSLTKIQGNTSLEIGDILAKLKSIAIMNNLTIFLQVHIKDPQDGSLREPNIRDIRDSGLIKSFADTVIGIWRVPNDTITEKGKKPRMQDIEETDTKAKVAVWKNRRNGFLGTFYLSMLNKFFVETYDKYGYKIQ